MNVNSPRRIGQLYLNIRSINWIILLSIVLDLITSVKYGSKILIKIRIL